MKAQKAKMLAFIVVAISGLAAIQTVRADASATDARTEIQQRYNKMEAAVLRKDLLGYFKYRSQGCIWINKEGKQGDYDTMMYICLLYTSPSPRDRQKSRMPSSA